ncbi:ABC transporter permease [Breznakiella homolactica]|uniref:FtsX-like permease family protein n=1 Tax=Breznakiella homolactica TaxID=2798577 RepID=A0A7T8BBJ1_9SPIR|nr:ABC transporter permease [Breznakiella homolactica]QQO10622.1 ABC transporter permease [Breznakiella homolactica]
MKRPHSFGKTYIKTILREIKGSFGRFVAIFAIVALGVGFLAGLLATTPDMKLSVGRYYSETNMMDIFVKATMGLTGADTAAVEALDEVAAVMPAYVTDALVRTSHEEVLVTRIYGLPLEKLESGAFVGRVELIEGRMPRSPDECLVQQNGTYLAKIDPGSRLVILPENAGNLGAGDIGDVYGFTEFTVTGIVKNPLYFSNEREPSGLGNGRLGAVMYIDENSYALSAYTDFYITLADSADYPAFSPEYEEFAEAAADTISLLGKERSLLRREEIVDAGKTLDEAREEYLTAKQDAERELADARKKLDDGRSDIAGGEAELADAEAKVAEGEETLAGERSSFERQIRENEEALRKGEAEIAAAKRQLAEAKAAIDAAAPDIARARAARWLPAKARAQLEEYDKGVAEYEQGMATVAEKDAEIRDGWRQLAEGRRTAAAEFAKAESELETARADIAAGRLDIEQAKLDLADGESQYRSAAADAAEKLADAEAQLADAENEIAGIDTPEWYVLDRNANVSYVTYKANAEKIADVATVFPLFFLLVAGLVALTTMTRMVEEERLQIGTLKAIGYRKRIISIKYLVYCGLTSVLGCIAGMVSGFQVIPLIIYNAFSTMYFLPPLVTAFNWTFGLIACGIILVCTMGATVSASYRSLREKPAALMLPRTPKAGKRIFLEYLPFIWNHMKFTYKSTARNLIRYKKHFFMTVIGIGGCTALMVTGFGLRDSMTDIARTQFERILIYDLRIELGEDEAFDPVLVNFLASVSGDGAGGTARHYTELHSEAGYALSGGRGRESATILIPEHPDELNGYISLRERKSGSPIVFTGSSVVVTEKMAESLGLKVGDSFAVENSDGRTARFVLSGITENYVGSYIYLNPAAYSDAFRKEISYQTLFVRTGITGAAAQDEALADVLSSSSVASAEFTSQLQQTYNNLLGSIGFVVLILIFAAGGLAIIVLYNLTNININERRRELATLRVLGYHHGEVAGYIFREITILSMVGAAVGLLLGIPLHRFVIGVAENVDLMFGRTITPLSFFLSAAATMVFSVGVDLLMLKKLRSIEMVDSMKAAE